jgi:hypothetical protein
VPLTPAANGKNLQSEEFKNNFFTPLGSRVNLYLPPISTTPQVLMSKFAANVVETGGKFANVVIDTGGAP